MKEWILYHFEFAVAIVSLVDGVAAPKNSYMTDRLARAGTSVGANIRIARYAQSKKDRRAKISIHRKTMRQYPKVTDRFLQNREGEYETKNCTRNKEVYEAVIQ